MNPSAAHDLVRTRFDIEGRGHGPETVVLFGNGAVENGWQPLLETVKSIQPFKADPAALQRYFGCPSFSGHALANATFLFRIHRSEFVRRVAAGEKDSSDMRNARLELKMFRKFREALGVAYQTAVENHAVRRRDLPTEVRTLTQSSTVGYITTNWDQLAWDDESSFPNLIQLHGRAGRPTSLILPTELTVDDDLLSHTSIGDLCRATGASEHDCATAETFWQEHCLRGEMQPALTQAHKVAENWLQNADHLIVWGLGMHPYDAELNTLLLHTNPRTRMLKKLTVVDTEKSKSQLAAMLTMFEPSCVDFIDASKFPYS